MERRFVAACAYINFVSAEFASRLQLSRCDFVIHELVCTTIENKSSRGAIGRSRRVDIIRDTYVIIVYVYECALFCRCVTYLVK